MRSIPVIQSWPPYGSVFQGVEPHERGNCSETRSDPCNPFCVNRDVTMRSITGFELNEMLLDDSTLLDTQYGPGAREATLRFQLDCGDIVVIKCRGVFQIFAIAHHPSGLPALGIEAGAGIEPVMAKFREQYVFEWELDCDAPIVPVAPWPVSLELVNLPQPAGPHRGIAVFKDTSGGHFNLRIVGTELVSSK
jgi:hypothetical protein